MEIINGELVIGDYSVGDEEELLAKLDKADKYDEIKATFFEGGEAQ